MRSRVLVALMLMGASVGLGSAGSASASTPTISPVPRISPANQQLVPADDGQQGLTLPPKTLPALSGTATQVLKGAVANHALDSQNANGYTVADGASVLQVFSAPVNFQDASGTWVPIDPSLAADGSHGLRTGPAPFSVTFPDTWSTASPITVSVGGGSYSFAVAGMSPATVSKTAAQAVSYASVLPDVNVRFWSNTLGYREAVVLGSASAAMPTFTITAQGLTLTQEPTGEIGLFDSSGKEVGIIPAPRATDSSASAVTGLGAEGSASYSLTDLGGGSYSLALTISPTFLATAKFPIVVDPPTDTLNPERDTSVSLSHTSTSYESDPELYVGNATTSDVRKGWLLFDMAADRAADRITEQATLSLYSTYVASNSSPVNLVAGTSSWPNPMTWNNQPSAAGTVYDSAHGAVNTWYQWDVTDLYQKILDTTTGYVNHGMRLAGDSGASPITNNYHRFASSETTIGNAQPQLFVQYDDQPSTPQLDTPANGDVVSYDSPTLSVQGKVSDPQQADTSHLRYQISKTSDFANVMIDSGWIPNGQSWTVPSGYLLDGQTYYWRVQSWDEWPLMGHSYPTSGVRSLTVSEPHYGINPQWPMWSDSAGNGIGIDVNESNGNLFVDYPLDTLQTPVGPLDIGLTYNSQQAGLHTGLGPGWVVSAGPGSDPAHLPVSLDTIDSGDAVQLTMRDGSSVVFSKTTKSGGVTYYTGGSAAGVGTIQFNSDEADSSKNTYIYKTTEGGRFIFDNSGDLTKANPETSDDGQPGFTYSYDASGHLTSVSEPLGRTVTMTYDGNGHLHTLSISKIGGGSTLWTINADASSGHPNTVVDPLGDTVAFGYTTEGDNSSYLTGITDGRQNTWSIAYQAPSGSSSQTRYLVSSVTDPGTYNLDDQTTAAIPPTTFSYAGPYTGQIDSTTTITDPRGNASGATAAVYQTTVDVDVAGHAVEVYGPPETINGQQTRPLTTSLYDTNGNMLCQRSPAANAKVVACTASTSRDPDNLSSVYTYETKSPHLITSKTLPSPNPDGTSSRLEWTYNYDEGLTGLLQENYANDQLSGIPAARQINTNTPATYNWGSGSPSGVGPSNGWSVRWTGKLHIATQGTYRFNLHHDDGARFTIGSTVLENCWGRQSTSQDYTTQYNCGTNTPDSIELWPGTYNIDIEYHDITGNAGVELKWDAGDPNGCCSDMQGSNADPGLNLLTSEQNPATLTTTYAYGSTEDRGLPASVTETTTGGLQRSDSKTYDSYGRVLTDANAAGTQTNVYSSTMPCLDHSVDRAGARTNYTCNSAGDILTTDQVVPAVAGTQQSTAQDRVTTTGYNALGQVTDVTQPGQSAPTHSDYYPNGLLEDTIDPMGRETTYAYNPATWLTTKTLPPDETPDNPLVTTYGYDAAGNQTFVTKALGSQSFEWAKTYDAQNRVTSSSVPGVSTPTTYQYDQIGTHYPADAGFLTSAVTDPAGVQTTTTTDMVGRTVATQVGTQSAAPLHETVDTYSGKGNLTNVTDPSGVSTAMSYDGFAEMVTKTMNTGTGGAAASVTYTYDNAGRVTDIQDQNLNDTIFGFDGDGRITSIQPDGVAAANAWQVVYDAAGDRVETVDPNGRHRDWTYDPMGRVSQAYEYPQAGSKSDPQASWLVTGYHYDADSELTSVDDPRGFERCYTYDNLGDQLSRYQAAADCANDPKTDLETFTYSPMSGMTGATEGSSGPSVAIAYGSANPDRIASVSEGAAETSYAYSAATGRVTSETDQLGPIAQQTGYAYDPTSGRLSSVTDPFTGLAATNYTYDDAGRVLSRSDIAGLTTTYAYDAAGRLSTQTAKTAGGSTVAAYGYSYDPASNITGYTQTLPQVAGQANPDSGSWAYTYDSQERLHTAQVNSQPTLTYGYDDSGDRTSVQVGSGTPTITAYDGADRVSTVGSTAYTWDNADELTGVGSSRSYTYDTWGRQSSATVGSTSVAYTYDALNRTLSRTPSAGSATSYTYAGLGQDVASATTGSDSTVYYAYAAGVPIAQQQGTTTRGYEQDPHGDLSVILDTAGTPTGTISYDPWGSQDAAVGSDATTSLLGYQSQPTDPTTGLIDMGARLYDPSQGRFTSEDSVFGSLTGPVTLNQYIYAGDSPLDNTDPTGNMLMCNNCTNTERKSAEEHSAAGIAAEEGYTGIAQTYGTEATADADAAATQGARDFPLPKPAPAPPVSVVRHLAIASVAGGLAAADTAFGFADFGRGVTNAYARGLMSAGGSAMASGSSSAAERSAGAALMYQGRSLAGQLETIGWMEHAAAPLTGVFTAGQALADGDSARSAAERGVYTGAGAAVGGAAGGALGAAAGGFVGSALPGPGTAFGAAVGEAAGSWGGAAAGAAVGDVGYDVTHGAVDRGINDVTSAIGGIF